MRMFAGLQNDTIKNLMNTTVNSSYASLVLRTAICFARCNWNPKNYRPWNRRPIFLDTRRRFMVTSLTYMHRHVGECVAQAHRTHFEKQAGRRKRRQIDESIMDVSSSIFTVIKSRALLCLQEYFRKHELPNLTWMDSPAALGGSGGNYMKMQETRWRKQILATS